MRGHVAFRLTVDHDRTSLILVSTDDLTHEALALTATEHATPAHPFAHIAPGPYRFAGMETEDDRADLNKSLERDGKPFTTNLSGGSCHHYWTAISEVYWFQCRTTGKRFKVGSTCVEKAHGYLSRSPLPADPALAAARLAARKAATVKRRAADARTIRGLLDTLADLGSARRLAAMPSPNEYRAGQGETMLDWAEWHVAHAGVAGKKKAAKAVRLALA